MDPFTLATFHVDEDNSTVFRIVELSCAQQRVRLAVTAMRDNRNCLLMLSENGSAHSDFMMLMTVTVTSHLELKKFVRGAKRIAHVQRSCHLRLGLLETQWSVDSRAQETAITNNSSSIHNEYRTKPSACRNIQKHAAFH